MQNGRVYKSRALPLPDPLKRLNRAASDPNRKRAIRRLLQFPHS
jgi:hypothetical protein